MRLGCLELRLETGRWARPRLAEEARLCQVCENPDEIVENEYHFLFQCPEYKNEREIWIKKLEIPANFTNLPQMEQFHLVLNHPSNVKYTAQYIIVIFDIRSKILSVPSRSVTNSTIHLLPHDQVPSL